MMMSIFCELILDKKRRRTNYESLTSKEMTRVYLNLA